MRLTASHCGTRRNCGVGALRSRQRTGSSSIASLSTPSQTRCLGGGLSSSRRYAGRIRHIASPRQVTPTRPQASTEPANRCSMSTVCRASAPLQIGSRT